MRCACGDGSPHQRNAGTLLSDVQFKTLQRRARSIIKHPGELASGLGTRLKPAGAKVSRTVTARVCAGLRVLTRMSRDCARLPHPGSASRPPQHERREHVGCELWAAMTASGRRAACKPRVAPACPPSTPAVERPAVAARPATVTGRNPRGPFRMRTDGLRFAERPGGHLVLRSTLPTGCRSEHLRKSLFLGIFSPVTGRIICPQTAGNKFNSPS